MLAKSWHVGNRREMVSGAVVIRRFAQDVGVGKA